MRTYIATTGVIFGLITAAHLMRIVVEPRFATDPIFILLTILTVALCVWAWRLLWLTRPK